MCHTTCSLRPRRVTRDWRWISCRAQREFAMKTLLRAFSFCDINTVTVSSLKEFNIPERSIATYYFYDPSKIRIVNGNFDCWSFILMSGFDFCELLLGLKTPWDTTFPHEDIKSFLRDTCIRIESRVFDLKPLSWQELVFYFNKNLQSVMLR